MATIDKTVADRVIAGEFPEDNCTRIVRYHNAFGGVSYGATFPRDNIDKYLEETPYVRMPEIYWDPAAGIDRSGEFET